MHPFILSALANLDDNITAVQAQLAETSAKLIQSEGECDALRAQLAAPTPLGVSIVLPSLQTRSDWHQPSNAGDSGGTSSKPSGIFTITPGQVATFSAAGNYPYNNGYWYIKTPGLQGRRFALTLDIQFPTQSDIDASQAIEFELQQSDGTYIYNMAWQCPVRSKTGFWRTFDYTARKWEQTDIPATLWVPGQWVSLVAEFELTTKTNHLTLNVDDEVHQVNIARDPTEVSQSKYLSVGFQLDSDGKTPPTPYSVLVRNFNVVVGE